jgi:hypothetical protein
MYFLYVHSAISKHKVILCVVRNTTLLVVYLIHVPLFLKLKVVHVCLVHKVSKSAATRRVSKQQYWVLTHEGSQTDTSLGETPRESVQRRATNKCQETWHVNNRLLYHNALPITAL